MEQRIAISIITPTYNRPDLLQRAIQSVQSQTFQNWEMIIVDDSTDDITEKLSNEFKKDFRIKYIKNSRNMGAAYCRNIALDRTKGEWVTFLDDDDKYVDKDALHNMITQTQNDKSAQWHTFMCVAPDGEARTRQLVIKCSYNWIKDFLYGRAFRGDAAHIIKRDLIGNTRNRGAYRAEWKFWYDLAQKSDFTYHKIPIVICEYLDGGLTDSWNGNRDRIFLRQQLFHALKDTKTWKHLPIIVLRYVASFSPIRKLINKLRNKHFSHET